MRVHNDRSQGDRVRRVLPKIQSDRSRHKSNVASVRPSSVISAERAPPTSPSLPSPVPSNFQFQQLDVLADPLPWEACSFDVVHVRFLLIHVRLHADF